jgi:hypothetical protein
MGYNSTVVVLNDALGDIERDPDFGKKLVNAIMSMPISISGVDVTAGCHCNAARVIESHHADNTTLVAIGGNDGEKYVETFGWNITDDKFKLRLLQEFADRLGYRVVKKIQKMK